MPKFKMKLRSKRVLSSSANENPGNKLQKTTADYDGDRRLGVQACDDQTLLVTSEGGQTWVTVSSDGGQTEVRVAKKDGRTVVSIISSDSKPAVEVQADGGRTEVTVTAVDERLVRRTDTAQSSYLDQLPAELLDKILSYLPLRSILPVQQVSHRWKQAVIAVLGRWQNLDYEDEFGEFDSRGYARAMKTVLPMMPGLQILGTAFKHNLSRRRPVWYKSPINIEEVIGRCPMLKEIDLTSFQFDEKSLLLLCGSCPLLEKIAFGKTCSDSHVNVLLRHLSGIRALTLNGCDNKFFGYSLALLPKTFERLSVISCRYFKISNLFGLPRFEHLEELRLTKLDDWTSSMDARLSEIFAGSPRLRVLELRPTRKFGGACFANLPLCLEDLSVCVHEFGSDPLRHVARCSQLRKLTIFGLYHPQRENLEYIFKGCRQLEKLTLVEMGEPLQHCLPTSGAPDLRHLKIVGGDFREAGSVTDETLEGIVDQVLGLHTLEILDINGLSVVTETGISCLMRRLKELRSLSISGCVLEDSWLPPLHGSKLEYLFLGTKDLSVFHLTPEGIAQTVLACPSLTSVDLYLLDPSEEEGDFYLRLVNDLASQLPVSRAVTLRVVDEFLKDERMPRPCNGPLRVALLQSYCEEIM